MRPFFHLTTKIIVPLIFVLFILTSCVQPGYTPPEETTIDPSKYSNQTHELLDSLYFNLLHDADNYATIMIEHFSETSKETLKKQLPNEISVDSSFYLIATMLQENFNSIMKNDDHFFHQIIGIKDTFKTDVEIAFMYETELILQIPSKNKEIADRGYVLIACNILKENWYIYQPEVEDLYTILENDFSDDLAKQITKKVYQYKPQSIERQLN